MEIGDFSNTRVLILEDDKERLKWFGQTFMSAPVYVTTPSASLAVDYLLQLEFDLIMLDHDLADEHYYEEMYGGIGGYNAVSTKPRPYDGRYVAKFLANNPDNNRDALIIVHSLNEARAQEMISLLEDAGRFPIRKSYFQLRREADE